MNSINNINLRNTNRDVQIFVINDLFGKKVTINFEEVPVKFKKKLLITTVLIMITFIMLNQAVFRLELNLWIGR